jgi:S-adenosylmethionine:tRNA ribosyltransferase-isomerase
MLVSDFHYDLPEDLIAQTPPAIRGASRMLTLSRQTGAYEDHLFTELPQLLQPGDLLILNDSRVLPARLYATRAGFTTQHNSPAPTGHIEVLLAQRLASDHNDWTALVKPAKKVQPGETLHFHTVEAPNEPGAPDLSHLEIGEAVAPPLIEEAAAPLLTAVVLTAGDFGERTLRFAPTEDFHATLDRIGHLPLPPYIHRPKSEPNTPEDRARYQTVYSTPFEQQRADPVAGLRPFLSLPKPLPRRASAPQAVKPAPPGSAAAPTAGLHFTPEVLEALTRRGVEISWITLHVGLGTFQPVRAERTEDIRLHQELYQLNGPCAAALNRATQEGRRIIAVGTTTARTLEHIARAKKDTAPFWPHSGSTSLFLSPGLNDQFKLVQGLLTNFHLPSSTLLMLVSALAGREATLAAYAHAVAARYRFFSYGDCMLIT